MNKVFLITAMAAFLCCSCGDPVGKKISKNNQIGLITEKGTALRIDPYVYSGKVGDLSRGEKTEILEASKVLVYVGKDGNYWYKVKTESGMIGWVFGKNLKIFSAGSDFSAGNFEKQLLEEDLDSISKELIGKWWTVNTRDEFTSYWVSLFKDGTYEAQHKDGGKLFKGKYSVSPADSKIAFDSTTPIGNEMKFSQRGVTYFIECTNNNESYRFKKISSDPKSAEQVETVNEQKAEETASAEVTPQQEKEINDKN